MPIVDYAIGASAVLGIRDSGKTVTSKGIAEQLLEAGVPIIVFDAVGKWRWMKVAAPHGKAFKIVVAGGREPDLPLTPHSVPEIVRAALRERIPLIIDLFSKDLSKSDWRKIVQTAIHIIHYENEGGAVHVFLEEAAEFVPQKVYDGETYAEVEKLVRMGGNASVGITLINQRSQEVNKAVLDNCSTALILGCQVGKNAIEAVEKWIERLDPKTAEEVTTSLPHLKAGEAWVWTRKSLTEPSREQMPMCRSFHPDRRTPEVVLKSAKPTDTAEFVAKMAASIPKVIEEAKANDPAELKRTIAKLKRELAVEKEEVVKPRVETKVKEVSVLSKSERNRLTALVKAFDKFHMIGLAIADKATFLEAQLSALKTEIRFFKAKLQPSKNESAHEATERRWPLTAPSAPIPREVFQKPLSKYAPEPNGDWNPGKCERRLLAVLSQFPEGCNRRKLILLAGYAWSGSTQNALGALRTHGAIEGGNDSVMTITDTGRQYADEWIPTGYALIDFWLNFQHFGKCERTLLKCFVEYPEGLDKEKLLKVSGYEWSGSTQNALGALRTAGVIVGKNNETMRLSDELLEALAQ